MKTMSDAYKYGFTRNKLDNTSLNWKEKVARLFYKLKRGLAIS